MLSQTAPDVPVYKVRQQNGNDTRVRTLHRNMLYPLISDYESDHTTNEPVSADSQTDVQNTSDTIDEYWSATEDEEEPYQAPVTHSKTKAKSSNTALARANVLLEKYFGVTNNTNRDEMNDETPIARSILDRARKSSHLFAYGIIGKCLNARKLFQ